MMRYALSFTVLFAAACGGADGPTLDELNATVGFADPSVDDTPAGAPFAPGQRRDIGETGPTYEGPLAYDFIEQVAMPGDLDGDGYGDLVTWGVRASDHEIVPCDDGCPGFSRLVVEVIYGGPELGVDGAFLPDASIESWHVSGLRSHVAPAGDLDEDGRADLLISVGFAGCEQGDVYVVRGGARLQGTLDVRDAGALLREEGTCTGFGGASGVGDVDGDGRSDFVITAPDVQRAYLYYGSSDAPPARRSEADASASFTGASFRGARAAGDVNGDGRDDLLLLDGIGSFWLVLGGERRSGELAIAEGATRIEAAQVSSVGDIDGDGLDDLGVTRDAPAGAPDGFLLAGRPSWPATLDPAEAGAWILRGTSIDEIGQTRLASAGDLNGDGHADLLYGDEAYISDATEGSPRPPPPRGLLLLWMGPLALDGGALAPEDATVFLGRRYESVLEHGIPRGVDTLGASLATGDDVDGDGIDDMALAAATAPDGGRVYFVRGRD